MFANDQSPVKSEPLASIDELFPLLTWTLDLSYVHVVFIRFILNDMAKEKQERQTYQNNAALYTRRKNK